MSGKVYKIAVVGDGPIGNLVIQQLLIEHYNNHSKHNNNIEITHYRSERCDTKGIKRYYEINLETENAGACYANDIFLTYYNVVLLIQFIKNVDLIIQNKKILAISEVLLPDDYKLIDKEFEKNQTRYNGKLQILS